MLPFLFPKCKMDSDQNVDIKSKHTTCMKLMNLSLTMDPACLNPSGEELAMAISVHCTPLSEDIYGVAVK